jgi:hypothetical protein
MSWRDVVAALIGLACGVAVAWVFGALLAPPPKDIMKEFLREAPPPIGTAEGRKTAPGGRVRCRRRRSR